MSLRAYLGSRLVCGAPGDVHQPATTRNARYGSRSDHGVMVADQPMLCENTSSVVIPGITFLLSNPRLSSTGRSLTSPATGQAISRLASRGTTVMSPADWRWCQGVRESVRPTVSVLPRPTSSDARRWLEPAPAGQGSRRPDSHLEQRRVLATRAMKGVYLVQTIYAGIANGNTLSQACGSGLFRAGQA